MVDAVELITLIFAAASTFAGTAVWYKLGKLESIVTSCPTCMRMMRRKKVEDEEDEQ